MDAKKAETIITAAAGMEYRDWERVRDMIERKFETAKKAATISEQDAEHAIQMLMAELPRG